MRIGITSENKLKIEAVKKAYLTKNGGKAENIEIRGYSTDSGVGEQPINKQTLKGARNRIMNLEKQVLGLDLIFSIENGIFYENEKYVDKAVVVVKEIKSGKEYVAYSEGVVFPDEYVERARVIGFDKTTVGRVMKDAGYIKDGKDPHMSISRRSRREYIEETVARLLEELIQVNN